MQEHASALQNDLTKGSCQDSKLKPIISTSKHSKYDDSGSDDDADDDYVEVAAEVQTRKKIDLKLLGDLITAASPTLAKVEGRNVVLLLGKTGVGKSTFIQAVAGKSIVTERYKRDSDGFEKDVFVAEHPLAEFSIGHDQSSETKNINQEPATKNELV